MAGELYAISTQCNPSFSWQQVCKVIKEHQLYAILPSLGYCHGKAIKALVSHQYRAATSEEEVKYLNALTDRL